MTNRTASFRHRKHSLRFRNHTISGVSRWLLVGLLLGPGLESGSGYAASSPAELPTIEDVQVGIGGTYKLGHWTPVAVTIRGGSQPSAGLVVTEVPDGEGVPSRIVWHRDRHVAVKPHSLRTVYTYAKFGRIQSDLVVTLQLDDGPPVSRTFAADQLPKAVLASQPLLVTIGRPLEEDNAIRSRVAASSDAVVSAIAQDIADLPTRWYGYSGVDGLIITTSDPEPCSQLTDEQIAAIDQWLHLGGRLLVCVGNNGQKLLGEGRLARLVPGTFSQVLPNPSVNELLKIAGDFSPAYRVEAAEDSPFGMTVLENIRGRIQADEGIRRSPRPSLIHAPWGLGQVYFCAVDLEAEPLRSWPGHDRLVARLLDMVLGSHDESQEDTRRGAVTHVGFVDLAGQLRAALDQFPSVLLVPFSVIAGLAVLYVVVIGPVDYFLLRKVGCGMAWTWLTFPMSLVLFSVLAYVLAHHWKGRQHYVNQVDLVDIDLESGWVRGTTWAHLYSPRTDTYDLALQPGWSAGVDLATRGVMLAWHGLPGRGLGGMASRGLLRSTSNPYDVVGEGRDSGGWRLSLERFPIPIWSSRSLLGQWWCQRPQGDASPLVSQPDGQLNGQFRNPLPVALSECFLFHEDWAYVVGPLEPRGTRSVAQLQLRRLEDRLIRRTFGFDQMENKSTPWDPESMDVPRIMEMIMFHEAAGGRLYTRLFHRYQSGLDLSDHLRLRRAVLVGAAKPPAATLYRDRQSLASDYDRNWTFYRIVFPVEEG